MKRRFTTSTVLQDRRALNFLCARLGKDIAGTETTSRNKDVSTLEDKFNNPE